MASVTIDPGVLAAPAPDVSRDEVEAYINTLLDWSLLLDEPWVAIHMSANAAYVLSEHDLYPLRDRLRELFEAQGVVEYSVNDVAVIAEKLLAQTPFFETYFSLRDVLYEHPHTEPDLLAITTHEHMALELARCVILFALLRRLCRKPITDHALVVRPWQGNTQVQVQARIHDLEHDRDDLDLPEFPLDFEGDVWVCSGFRELVTGLDEAAVWQGSDSDEGVGVSIQIALYKMRLERGLDPDWGDDVSFRFGSGFVDRAAECFKDNPVNLIHKTLRAIAETLDGEQMQAIHALREGNAGGTPQRTRGGDKAWRRDIDREYHLHYWECTDGTIELGWMGPHNDFRLPE